MAIPLHVKARQAEYQGKVKRFPVPDEKVPWSVAWAEYSPVDYTAEVVLKGPVWADPDIRVVKDRTLHFNALDGKVDRRSHNGEYAVVGGVPRNPAGRTGMSGRGLLGRWGPNHAADPIATRWMRTADGKIATREGKGVLEFVAIKRKDTGTWAIPGGMVEAGDTVSATLKKEFGEEAMNSIEASEEEKKHTEELIAELFHSGTQVYAGYVDDPRNTDNAWMETVAFNFHDETGEAFSRIKLQAGDDAGAVKWTELSKSLDLYASHTQLVQEVVKLRNAAW
eukprot:Em0015g1071a